MEKKKLKEINNFLATFLYDKTIKEIRIKKLGNGFDVQLSEISETWSHHYI